MRVLRARVPDPTFALRFFSVFGSRQSPNNPCTGVAAIFISRYLNGRAPLVFEDGLQSRDFIDVRDAARAIQLATKHEGSVEHVLRRPQQDESFFSTRISASGAPRDVAVTVWAPRPPFHAPAHGLLLAWSDSAILATIAIMAVSEDA